MSFYSKSELDDSSYLIVGAPSPYSRRLDTCTSSLNIYEKSDWKQVSVMNKSLSNQIQALKNHLNKKTKELEVLKTEMKKEKDEKKKLKREMTLIKHDLSTKNEEMKAKEKSHMEELQALKFDIESLETTERKLREKIKALEENNDTEEYERERQTMLKSEIEIQELKETIEGLEMALKEKDQLLENKAAEAYIMEKGFEKMTGEMASLQLGQKEMRNEFMEEITQVKHIMQAAFSAGQICPVSHCQTQMQYPKREKADEFLPPIIKNKQDKQDKPWRH